jgi:FMN-dependent NADH-azoreductase
MTTLPHLNAFERGQFSRSRAIANTFIETRAAKDAGSRVDTLDLFAAGLPDFGAGY